MQVYEILDKLQLDIENAQNVPLTGKVMIDKDEVLDLIDDLRAAVPNEIAEAKRIREDEERIRISAQHEANKLIKEAREQKQHLIDTNNITKNAYDEAETIIADAKAEAARYRVRSIEYMTNMLSKVQDDLRGYISRLDENKSELKEKRKEISNKKNAE